MFSNFGFYEYLSSVASAAPLAAFAQQPTASDKVSNDKKTSVASSSGHAYTHLKAKSNEAAPQKDRSWNKNTQRALQLCAGIAVAAVTAFTAYRFRQPEGPVVSPSPSPENITHPPIPDLQSHATAPQSPPNTNTIHPFWQQHDICPLLPKNDLPQCDIHDLEIHPASSNETVGESTSPAPISPPMSSSHDTERSLSHIAIFISFAAFVGMIVVRKLQNQAKLSSGSHKKEPLIVLPITSSQPTTNRDHNLSGASPQVKTPSQEEQIRQDVSGEKKSREETSAFSLQHTNTQTSRREPAALLPPEDLPDSDDEGQIQTPLPSVEPFGSKLTIIPYAAIVKKKIEQEQSVIKQLNANVPLSEVMQSCKLSKADLLQMAHKLNWFVLCLNALDAFDGEGGLEVWTDEDIQDFLARIGDNLRVLTINSKNLTKLPTEWFWYNGELRLQGWNKNKPCLRELLFVDCSGCKNLEFGGDKIFPHCWFLKLTGCQRLQGKTLKTRKEQFVVCDKGVTKEIQELDLDPKMKRNFYDPLWSLQRDPLLELARIGKHIIEGNKFESSELFGKSNYGGPQDNEYQSQIAFRSPLLLRKLIDAFVEGPYEIEHPLFKQTEHGATIHPNAYSQICGQKGYTIPLKDIAWRSLGAIFSHILKNFTYRIGQRFHPEVFQALLSFSSEELEKFSFNVTTNDFKEFFLPKAEKGHRVELLLPAFLMAKQIYVLIGKREWDELQQGEAKAFQDRAKALQDRIEGQPIIHEEVHLPLIHPTIERTRFLDKVKATKKFFNYWKNTTSPELLQKFYYVISGSLHHINGEIHFRDAPETAPWIQITPGKKWERLFLPAYSKYENFKADLEKFVTEAWDSACAHLINASSYQEDEWLAYANANYPKRKPLQEKPQETLESKEEDQEEQERRFYLSPTSSLTLIDPLA